MANPSTEQREIRIEKLKKLEAMGINPYPQIYKPTAFSDALNAKYKDLAPDTQTDDEVKVAGRVMAYRNSGMFMDIYGKLTALGALYFALYADIVTDINKCDFILFKIGQMFL